VNTKPTLCHSASAAPAIGANIWKPVGIDVADVLTRPISSGGVSRCRIVGDAIRTPADATPITSSTGTQTPGGASRSASSAPPISATRPPMITLAPPSRTNGFTPPP
jgi:hypothetical protein